MLGKYSITTKRLRQCLLQSECMRMNQKRFMQDRLYQLYVYSLRIVIKQSRAGSWKSRLKEYVKDETTIMG